MKNPATPFLPTLSLLFLLSACQPSSQPASEGPGTEVDTTVNVQSETTTPAAPSFERLDQLDLSTLRQTGARQTEAGDCGNFITRYAADGFTLAIDSLDCGDYGWGSTYYLLDGAGKLLMVHVKYTEPFVDYDTKQFYYALSERVINFSGAQPAMKARVDTLPQSSPETAVQFNDNFQGAPWITVNARGDDFVLGKKIDYSGDWYNRTKKAVKDSLMRLSTLPRPVPIRFSGELGMGIRGEFRSLGEEALQEVAPNLEYERRRHFNHFSRSRKPLVGTKEPAADLSQAYWEKRYGEL